MAHLLAWEQFLLDKSVVLLQLQQPGILLIWVPFPLAWLTAMMWG